MSANGAAMQAEVTAGQAALPLADDEGALLRRLGAGEREAAELLVERTYAMVFAVLVRMCDGDVETAADLTQETYRRAWSSIASFAGRSRFSTWLYRIAYTTFLNHVRRPHRVLSIDDEHAATLADPAPDQEESAATRQRAARLRRAVLALPEAIRFTVVARYWAGLPAAEIARGEGISEVAVRKRLRKAMGLLAGALGEV